MAEGHRARVRMRANEQDPDTIPEYEVLEMILHGVVKRCDVGGISRALITEFGSLANVIDAPAHRLCEIKGVGKVAADFIKKIPFFYNKYMQSKDADIKFFTDVDSVMSYLQNRFIGKQNESFAVMCLNSKLRLISCRFLFEGSINAVDIDSSKIMDFALASKASRVIIAHNHPDGDPTPSNEDFLITKIVYNMLSTVKIALDDHIIVTDKECSSIATIGKIPHSIFKSQDD